jgi:hypothetical protein
MTAKGAPRKMADAEAAAGSPSRIKDGWRSGLPLPIPIAGALNSEKIFKEETLQVI